MALGGQLTGPGEAGSGVQLDLDRPLVDLVARWAAEIPGEPAFTYVDYAGDPEGRRHTLTWGQTHRRAKAAAARLRQVVEPGDRVALLIPQGLDYLTSLIGCFYARAIAVPLFSPDLPGHADRLSRSYADAEPAAVVTTTAALGHVTAFLDGVDVPPREVVTADTVEVSLATAWRGEELRADDVAYLQYTSGSTRDPAGVEITHRNVTANAAQVWASYRGTPRTSKLVAWLPLFHDMGLISVFALPTVGGNEAIFTDPVAFVMHPMRWMSLLSGLEDAYTAGPNFAYEYCVSRATDADLAGLDLSGLKVAANGAEPIRPVTLESFAAAFAPAGLRPEAPSPSYGLAEATVYVSARTGGRPRVTAFDRDGLTAGIADPVRNGAERVSQLVSCGSPVGQLVAIVDPETHLERPDGQVGEIWVNGPNVARGYWRNPEKTAEVFGAVLKEPGPLPADGWLRTGDYGVAHEGELYVTGRIKDLVVVDGRNHYPQDVEATAQESHPAIRRDHVAAFSVTVDGAETLVVVAERSRRGEGADTAEVERSARAAISAAHDLRVYDFVLVLPGGVPRTSSGKIARTACRQRYLADDLPRVRASGSRASG